MNLFDIKDYSKATCKGFYNSINTLTELQKFI